jgi:hypothetical protein
MALAGVEWHADFAREECGYGRRSDALPAVTNYPNSLGANNILRFPFQPL